MLKKFISIKTGKGFVKNTVIDGKYIFHDRSNIVKRINSYSFDGEYNFT